MRLIDYVCLNRYMISKCLKIQEYNFLTFETLKQYLSDLMYPVKCVIKRLILLFI